MSPRGDHKALIFLGAVAVLGASVRIVRGLHREGTGGPAAVQPALQRQARAADSAANAARSRQRTSRRSSTGGRKSTRSGRRSASAKGGLPSRGSAPVGALDRPGYISGKLDVDVATVAQLDSLPGIGPTLARRIVIDRTLRGPFITPEGLRRVTGIGPALLSRIDTLITFTGTIARPDPADTVGAGAATFTRPARARPRNYPESAMFRRYLP